MDSIKYISTNLQGGLNVDCMYVYVDILGEELSIELWEEGREKNILELHGFLEI